MEERFKTFTLLTTNIVRSIRKIKTGEMVDYDLKSQHVSCLYYVYKEKSLTAKEICELCDEDKANISRSIKFLEERGYVTYESKRAKRYLTPVTLTDKGVEIAKYISDRIDEVLLQSSLGISEDELVSFYRCLAKINDSLQRISDQYDR